MHDSITTIIRDLVAQATSEYMGHPGLALSLTAVSVPRSLGSSVGLKVQVAYASGQSDFVALWADSRQRWEIEVLDFDADDLVEVAAADPRAALAAWMVDVNAHVADVEGESA